MNLMSNEWSRSVFSFSRIKTPKGKISTHGNNENYSNGRHGKNVWLEVMIYGLSAARSVRHDREPNISAWQKLVNKHFITWPLRVENFEIRFNLSRTRYTGARGRIIKNIRQLKNFCFVFRVRAKISQFIKRRNCVFTLFFPSSFCKKAVWVRAEWLFSGATHVYPSGRTHFSFHHDFLWDCTRRARRVIW